MKPVSGLMLGNRYRLVRQIAVGGMGEVWVAQDTALGRDVAVKVLREEFAGNEDFLERLRTEAKNSAALSHRNIAQMFDYGEQRGSGYLVMELVRGEPMADLLEREPVLPAHLLYPILAQTAAGLHAAHSAGVVHRDIKPGNILLDQSGEVKITDFGVSLAANQVPMTATGMVMGTAQYLSPEQAIGQAATGASDIYALGVIAYESAVGHRPFTGVTPVDIAVAHVNEVVPPLPPSVDPELSELIMMMLAKDPHDRPMPADALARALDDMARRAEDGEPIHVRDASSTTSTSPAIRQRTRRARREEAEPIITPLVIPAAVRQQHGPASAVHRGTSDSGTPVLPWERPGSPSAVAPSPRASDSPAPRSYPPRRELRDTVTRDESSPSLNSDSTTRAERRLAHSANKSQGWRFTRFTWLLVALLGLLLALVVATVITQSKPDSRSDSQKSSSIVMTSWPSTPSPAMTNGMMAPVTPYASWATDRTTSEDV